MLKNKIIKTREEKYKAFLILGKHTKAFYGNIFQRKESASINIFQPGISIPIFSSI